LRLLRYADSRGRVPDCSAHRDVATTRGSLHTASRGGEAHAYAGFVPGGSAPNSATAGGSTAASGVPFGVSAVFSATAGGSAPPTGRSAHAGAARAYRISASNLGSTASAGSQVNPQTRCPSISR
jgi:hypothetical protein